MVVTKEALHKCKECEKEFKEKSNLRQHMIVHSAEKPFQCDICDKSFNPKYTKEYI